MLKKSVFLVSEKQNNYETLVILSAVFLLKKPLVHFYNGQGTRDIYLYNFLSCFVPFRGHEILKTTQDRSGKSGNRKITETASGQEG